MDPMQKMCSWNLVMQQVISRLQQDFKVTTQPWPECLFATSKSFDFEVCWSVGLYVCLFVCMYVCLLAHSRPQF